MWHLPRHIYDPTNYSTILSMHSFPQSHLTILSIQPSIQSFHLFIHFIHPSISSNHSIHSVHSVQPSHPIPSHPIQPSIHIFHTFYPTILFIHSSILFSHPIWPFFLSIQHPSISSNYSVCSSILPSIHHLFIQSFSPSNYFSIHSIGSIRLFSHSIQSSIPSIQSCRPFIHPSSSHLSIHPVILPIHPHPPGVGSTVTVISPYKSKHFWRSNSVPCESYLSLPYLIKASENLTTGCCTGY